MSRPAAVPVTHIDDDRVRVTEWRFEPGAETGWHRHGLDYVVVPLTDGDLLLEEPGGATRRAALTRHAPYSRAAGVEHNVVNGGDAYLAFLEVEIRASNLVAERRAVMARYAAAWTLRDAEALAACMAEDCRLRLAAGPGSQVLEGQSAIRDGIAAALAAAPEAVRQGIGHDLAGEAGVVRWRLAGRDGAGRTVEVEGCDLLRFEGALIAEVESFRIPPG